MHLQQRLFPFGFYSLLPPVTITWSHFPGVCGCTLSLCKHFLFFGKTSPLGTPVMAHQVVWGNNKKLCSMPWMFKVSGRPNELKGQPLEAQSGSAGREQEVMGCSQADGKRRESHSSRESPGIMVQQRLVSKNLCPEIFLVLLKWGLMGKTNGLSSQVVRRLRWGACSWDKRLTKQNE